MEYCHDIRVGKDFLNRTQKRLLVKEKSDNVDFLKI